MKPVRSGRFRQRVQLQQLGPETFDSFSQPIVSWQTIGTYWAYVRPLQGRELVVAKQIKAELTHAVTFRWLGIAVVVKPENRLILTDSQGTVHTFGSLEVLNTEFRNRQLDLVCQEIQ
jgi:SPP1 family predicted phage head-tail adaptor